MTLPSVYIDILQRIDHTSSYVPGIEFSGSHV